MTYNLDLHDVIWWCFQYNYWDSRVLSISWRFKTYVYIYINLFTSTIKKKVFIIYLIKWQECFVMFYYLILYTINNEKIMKNIVLNWISWKHHSSILKRSDIFSLKQRTTMYIFNKQKLLPFGWDVLFYPLYSSNLAICFLLVLYIEKFSQSKIVQKHQRNKYRRVWIF